MNLEQTIKLLDAGYTREEILAMNKPEEKPAEPEPEPAKPEQHAEPEIPAWASQITADIADLKKALYAVNVMASAQPEQKSVDEVLMNAMKGGK